MQVEINKVVLYIFAIYSSGKSDLDHTRSDEYENIQAEILIWDLRWYNLRNECDFSNKWIWFLIWFRMWFSDIWSEKSYLRLIWFLSPKYSSQIQNHMSKSYEIIWDFFVRVGCSSQPSVISFMNRDIPFSSSKHQG